MVTTKKKIPKANLSRLATIFLVFFCMSFELSPWVRKGSAKHSVIARLDQSDDYLLDDEDTADYWQNRLLTEAVINIVKNYYVDAEKTKPLALLSATKSGLLGQLNINIKDTDKSTNLDLLGHRYSLDHKRSETYGGLAEEMTGLVQWLHDLNLDLKNISYDSLDSGESLVLQSMLSALDAHSGLLSAEAYEDLRQGTEGKFGGLGLLVGFRDDLLTVIKPLPGSPAERGGIMGSDHILSINGHDTFGYSLQDLVGIMKGDPGTTVDLKILRDQQPRPNKLSLKREVITVNSVQSKIYDWPFAKVLYANIDSFSARTNIELLKVIENYQHTYKSSVQGLILDLRSNPGGLLEQAVKVSDIFIKSGTIVTTLGRRIEKEVARGNSIDFRCPIVLLIDSDSASASEIVAGALQDHDRVVTIGEQSYGKGSVQTIFELPKNQALKLTIARYYTPKSRSIQNVGIIPDIWLHPVFESTVNKNLLGTYRYKNEKFLPHTLKEQTLDEEQSLAGRSTFSGYYLVKSGAEVEQADPNIEMARRVFQSVYKKQSFPLPDEANNGTSWLAMAKDSVTAELDAKDHIVESYLKESHRINWQKSDAPLQINFSLNNPTATLSPGEDLTIPFKIDNQDERGAAHLSVFATSDRSDFPTVEKMVGYVKGSSSLNDNLVVHFPPEWPKGHVKIQIGIAKDGTPLSQHSVQFLVNVVERPMAKLDVSMRLVEEQGGVIQGKLERKENAKLEVSVRNLSPVVARALRVHMINLSGAQINLPHKNELVQYLKPQQSIRVYFDITAADKIYDQNLDVGVLVDSNDLKAAFKKSIRVEAVPNEGEL